MKAFRELDLKKILKSLLKDSLKKKVFLISFGIFFSTLAFAAALTVTWLSRHLPANPVSLGCLTHDGQVINIDTGNSSFIVEEDTFEGGSADAGIGYTTASVYTSSSTNY